MFVSPAQAPYAGVYQRQPTGIPRAEFIPEYPVMASNPSSNGHQAPMQYPPEVAYQNNGFGGQQVSFYYFFLLINK